jgi:hypothetical protein
MTGRATHLHATADGHIAELIGFIAAIDDATLRLPCPGREKLGDGTIAASARHTADNYQRIAEFLKISDRMSGTNEPSQHGGRPIPRFLGAFGHGPPEHAANGPGAGERQNEHTADNIDLNRLVKQLTAARATLGRIAELTDSQPDAIPPKDSSRFCDGQRTLEQVLAGLLKHQGHQVAALTAAIV